MYLVYGKKGEFWYGEGGVGWLVWLHHESRRKKRRKHFPFPKKGNQEKKGCDGKKCCTNVTKMGRHFCCNDAVYFEKKVEAIFVLSLKYVHLIRGVIRFPEFRARIFS